MNLYEYVFNSPTNYVDPYGEFAWLTIPFLVAYLILDNPDTANAPNIGDVPRPSTGTQEILFDTAIGVATAGVTAKVCSIAGKQVTVIGHNPEYIEIAKKMKANYFKPMKVFNWQKQGDFIKRVIRRGDDIFVGTRIEPRPSILKREIKQLIKAGYRPKSPGSSWLIKQ